VTSHLHDLASSEKGRVDEEMASGSDIQASENDSGDHVLEGDSKVKCDTDENTTAASKPILTESEGQPSRLLDDSSDRNTRTKKDCMTDHNSDSLRTIDTDTSGLSCFTGNAIMDMPGKQQLDRPDNAGRAVSSCRH